jgi:transcriptional regulator with XRE-family HTH domain
MDRLAVVPKPFGARARARRLAVGRSALETAAAAGMAPSNYARMEAGRHRPRLDTLERVAAALGTSVHDLLKGRE